MADGKGESRAGLGNGDVLPPAPSARCLAETLRALEDSLKEEEVTVATSSAYCSRFCEALLQHTEDSTVSEDFMLCADVYETALRCFANARGNLTTECEDVVLLLERLVLSCFEVVLSVSEDDLSSDHGLRLKKSIMESHEKLMGFGNSNLQLLIDNLNHGGVWRSPVLVKILSKQSVEPEEVHNWILQESTNFLQMRIKYLMKTNCIQQAMLLSKACSECEETSSDFFFRQSLITCLCTMLPDDEAFKEISKMSGQDVLDAICNLESEGQINTAFILCTTYLTQQLQNEVTSCSWELTLFWSKLQRRIDPCLNTFLERCRQFGLIAKTRQHLFFLIKVVHTEANDEGVPVSIMLCIRALQITSNETEATKTSVCKTIACLLPQDLEVRRACQLTEFLFEPTAEALNTLEELYLQPDQKNVEESSVISNSLRCELLLALKSHWLFDPEFWDWKTLKRHCQKILGIEVSDTEEDNYGEPSGTEPDLLDSSLSFYDDHTDKAEDSQEYASNETENVKVKKPVGSSERYKRWLQYKFYCVICNREVIEARILHHAKMHCDDGVYTCPVCVKKFRKKEVFVPHVMDHMKMPMRHRPKKKGEILEPQENIVNISEPLEDENNPNGYISFRTIRDKHLQDRDVYPCPGTNCSRVFKQFKYLSIHLKAEHQNNDENAKHYLDLKNMREKCAFCRRHFITNFHLKQHMKIHMGSHPFMCVSIDCNGKFKSINELLHHKHTHLDLQYKCELEGCHLVFSDLGLLYHHEAQHFRDAAYLCTFPRCKKFYYCRTELEDHIATHLAHTGNTFGNGTELLKNLKSEESGLNDSLFNYMPSFTDKTETATGDFYDEQFKTESCLYHASGLDQSDVNLHMCTCSKSDSSSVIKQEYSQNSCAHQQDEMPCKTLESVCSIANPEKADIKIENDIPSSKALKVPPSLEDPMLEILTRLKQLDLKNSDTCVQETVAGSSNSSASTVSQNGSTQKSKVLSQFLSQLSSKPFFCELKGCKSAFVTKAALLLHYCKKHGYTKDKALKLHMFQRRYSPFECHLCQRRFTRRTLLRIHYKNDHHIAKEKGRTSVRKFEKKIKPRLIRPRRKGCWEKLLANEASDFNDLTSPSQEGFNSETYGDSLSSETDSSNALGALISDDFQSGEGRGSRRVVEKEKLCYVLNKYHKPFHCIHKTCNVSFANQRGLVRHYQLVHQYNKESLCLEKDKEQNQKETTKCRKIFTCKFEECGKSFICGRALTKHYKEFHDQSEIEEKEFDSFENENYLQSETEEDDEKFSEESETDESEIYCDVEGCHAVFRDHTNYSRHIMLRHRKYDLYDTQRKRKKKAAEVDENYIAPKRKKGLLHKRKVAKIKNSDGNEVVGFKTREEALQMCVQNVSTTQFPCMVRGCASVVKLESSIIRHYKLTHRLNPIYVTENLPVLVYCVKNLQKSRLVSSSPERRLRGDKISRLSLRSVNNSTSNERGDSYKTPKSDHRRNGSVERDCFVTSPHHNKISKGSFKETVVRSSFCRNEEQTAKPSGKENVSSFSTEDKAEIYKESHPQSPAHSDDRSSTKGSQVEQVETAIELTNFKPMGFESSFLKFLQESRVTDEEDSDSDDLEWNYKQKSKQFQNSVQNRKPLCKDRNVHGVCLSLGKTASSEPTFENLRTMLDKALTDCGDLALKQLHQLYQRPVVVLERSDFTAPLIELFSSKKTDELCVGIS
ncbi:zinc finger protein Rlf [Hyperolius riggenbachi]|uniref:zinc finger protein Rlf n=1 Tax=Hyperolius riggenbachi TaxID=752182 RepID=UPI0035A3CC00